ncbi:MAG: PIN domain-containing protein [Armatimonadetes bacterium]|nr:PIN domain-containing protein [Armatimonadota bacterium]
MTEALSLYLDACCLNRPYDDPSQERVWSETEAVKSILRGREAGRWQIIGSDALLLELDRTPDEQRRKYHLRSETFMDQIIMAEQLHRDRAAFFHPFGIQPLDALHLAIAELGGADFFLTTDDRLLRSCRRLSTQLRLKVMNPLQWIEEVEAHE